MIHDQVQILGINFFNGNVKNVFETLNKNGGLLTVPAAPALATIQNDPEYYNALLKSDVVIPDSGYMVLIWNTFFKKKITKISGLEFINYFIKAIPNQTTKNLFLINPSEIDSEINKEFFNDLGLQIDEEASYSAPYYKNNVVDNTLIDLIEKNKPNWIIINLGGGTQEKLGLFIKNKLSYSPAIICTGAALAFKTGRQVNIPVIIDKLYLGWLFRCFSNPKLFIPRYLKGFSLIKIILQFKEERVT
jgi:UDP-N-acetyl-D-mannosaminuronic acid transferase (WecB/TagA/CpsF family)